MDKKKEADILATKVRERIAMTQDDLEWLSRKINWLLIDQENSIKSETLKQIKVL